jgi:hypothetical protein
MRVPNDPNYRQTMLHPPEFDGQYAAPGMTLSSDEHSTARRTQTPAGIFFRNLWVNIWGWQQVNSESSMFFMETDRAITRMECRTDDFCLTGPDHATLEHLCKPFKTHWEVTVQKLTDDTPISCQFASMDVVHEPADTSNDKYVPPATTSIQHVGLKIERQPDGGLTISNPKGIDAYEPMASRTPIPQKCRTRLLLT